MKLVVIEAGSQPQATFEDTLKFGLISITRYLFFQSVCEG